LILKFADALDTGQVGDVQDERVAELIDKLVFCYQQDFHLGLLAFLDS
jgi:hypothetical protein